MKIEGRAELPGRPLLYATTDYFFEHFGIKSIEELPNAAELRSVQLPSPSSVEGGEDGPPSQPPAEPKQLALIETPAPSQPSESSETP